MFWGYTPALDLLREYIVYLQDSNKKENDKCKKESKKKEDSKKQGRKSGPGGDSSEEPGTVSAADGKSEVAEATGNPAALSLHVADSGQKNSVSSSEEGLIASCANGVRDQSSKADRNPDCKNVQENDLGDDPGRRAADDEDGHRRGAQEVQVQDGDSRAAVTLLPVPGAHHSVRGEGEGPGHGQNDAHSRRHVDIHGAVVESQVVRNDGVRPDSSAASSAPNRDSDCGQEMSCVGPAAARSRDTVGLFSQDGGQDDSNRETYSQVPDTRTTNIFDPNDIFSTISVRNVNDNSDQAVVNILLMGAADARHILKTLSRLHHHKKYLQRTGKTGPVRVRIFVVEAVMELVARQLVFILAALEPADKLGSLEKVRLMMELMGNTLIRPGTARWLRQAARTLLELVTDSVLQRRRVPLVNLQNLRHQDRDRLEDIFSFYQQRPQSFRIGFHWDQRLRRHLKTRYDTRTGAFDWDYYMALRDLPRGDRVCVYEYRHWRETGVAFTWLEGEPTEPNLSLAAGVFKEGGNLLHGGYLGDITTSPYITYSLELEEEDQDMFRKANDKYVKRSTDMAERHMTRITHEIINQAPYDAPKEVENRSGVLISEVTDLERLNPEAPALDQADLTVRNSRLADDMLTYSSVPLIGAEVVFLSPRFLEHRHNFARKFDLAFLGRGVSEKYLKCDLARTMIPGGIILVEGTMYLLERPEERQAYADSIAELAEQAGLIPERCFSPHEDNFARFIVPGNNKHRP